LPWFAARFTNSLSTPQHLINRNSSTPKSLATCLVSIGIQNASRPLSYPSGKPDTWTSGGRLLEWTFMFWAQQPSPPPATILYVQFVNDQL
jgi:hypothetical protein